MNKSKVFTEYKQLFNNVCIIISFSTKMFNVH